MSSVQTHQLPDYYSILKADPLAKIEQIENLFRQLATEAQTSGDHADIPKIIEAFEVLRDPAKRQQYDHKYFALAQANKSRLETQATSTPAVSSPAMSSDLMSAMQPGTSPAETAAPTPVAPQTPMQHAPLASVQQSPQQPTTEPSLEIPNTPEPETEEASEPFTDGFGSGDVIGELTLKPEELQAHRRELLKIFYERRRKDVRKSGIAIGGLDSLVRYSYELLEFHLWIMSESKLITREESGALSISALGSEQHEQNVIDGLIKSGL